MVTREPYKVNVLDIPPLGILGLGQKSNRGYKNLMRKDIMSQTVPNGILPITYWAYMASAVAESMERVITDKAITPETLPLGVFNGLQEYFAYVVQGAKNLDGPTDWNTAYHEYKRAKGILDAITGVTFSPEQAIGTLTQLSDFAKTLRTARRIGNNGEERSACDVLFNFFAEMVRRAQAV